jgi:hypothetical protein
MERRAWIEGARCVCVCGGGGGGVYANEERARERVVCLLLTLLRSDISLTIASLCRLLQQPTRRHVHSSARSP